MNRRYSTTFLFPKTSFIVGMGSIFNIQGNYFLFNTSDSPEEADAKAIESDWGVTGQDIEEVIEKVTD